MITLITDRVAIGDANDANHPGIGLDAILNVADELDVPLMSNTVHKHKVGLVDGPGNDDFTLLSAVLMLHSLSRKYNRVLIHCQDGTHRSIMVVSVYISILKDLNLDEVLKKTMDNRNVNDFRKVLYQQYSKLYPVLKNLIAGK